MIDSLFGSTLPVGEVSSRPNTRLEELLLSEREQRVLEAVVNAHIDSREPVGSKTLAQLMPLSPASIRNVMAALHERGLINKPHASAGRIPTSAGLRYYVDMLLKMQPAPGEAELAMRRVADAGSVDRGMEEAGRVLSRLSQKACLIRAPRPRAVRLRQIELLRLRDDALLVILVTADGSVQNRLVEIGPVGGERLVKGPLPAEVTLERMSRYLSERVAGKTLAELRPLLEAEIASAREEAGALEQEALRLGRAAMGELPPPDAVVIEGQRHLVAGSSSQDPSRLSGVFSVLEERTRLLELLDRAEEAPGVRIFIGEENPLLELADLSVVTSTYGADEEVFGTLGVIGPVHMDYARVVPLVELAARAISQLLA
jgi:heat-inducible transcriptional repressor